MLFKNNEEIALINIDINIKVFLVFTELNV